MRQAGARRSQARALSWERLAPAWRVTEMAKLQASGSPPALDTVYSILSPWSPGVSII